MNYRRALAWAAVYAGTVVVAAALITWLYLSH